MKKLLILLLLSVIVLVAVLLVRAEIAFKDSQLHVDSKDRSLLINEAAAVQRFADSIRFATISNDDRSQFDPEPFNALHQHIQSSFPRVHSQSNWQTFNAYSLLYQFKGSDPSLKPALFMGHIDVVPVDETTRDQWQHPPFSGDVVGGVVWGRGTVDDKVTVFALLEAMERMLEKGIMPKRTIYFAFGHDEEVGGSDGAAVIADYFKQQNTQFEFVLDEGGAITEGILTGMTQPVALIGIAEKGFVNLRLTVNAPGGHSSQPPDHTAVGILSQAIVNIENNQFDTDLTFSKMTIDSVGYYAPLSLRLPMANLWLLDPLVVNSMLSAATSAAGIRTTIAATMLSGSSKSNILPTQASAVVNVRIMPQDTVASVKEHIVEAVDDPRVNIETFMENEPSAVSPTDSLGYTLIERTIRSQDSNVLVAPYLVIGGTDSKHFYGLTENVYRFMMVRLTPETLKQFHGVNEHLPVEDYLNAVTFYYEMLEQTANGQI